MPEARRTAPTSPPGSGSGLTGGREAEILLDVKGLCCPLPVLRANRSLREMAAGARLRVLATDPAAAADFPSFCRETGHALLTFSDENGVLSFVIRKRAQP